MAERIIGILLILGVLFWMGANLVKSPSDFFQNMVTGVNRGALYALIALGYTLVYGIIELINFAHGDLFMLGTILAANMMVNWLGLEQTNAAGFFGLALTMIVCMAFAAALNVGAEFFAYRRLRSAPKLAALITAVGLSFIFQNAGQLINGSGQQVWNTVFNDAGFTIGGVLIKWSFLVIVGVTTLLLLALSYIVQRTRQGKAMRAVAQDQDGARLMGVNVNATISFTFALGGAMAGAAAALYMEVIGTTRYDAGFQLGLFAFTAAVLGGIGNLVGAVIGGVLIGVIQALNAGGYYGLGSQWSNTVIFSILILTLVFKPEGILGKRTTEKV
jgi:branched-chain amino acid transport system permease protein